MRVLLINGPPRCGKDTIGEILCAQIPNARVDKFARVLKERTHALYGLVMEGKPYVHDFFEDCKDEQQSQFYGLTPRAAYIAVSERYMKPVHGQWVCGNALMDELKIADKRAAILRQSPPLHIITDSGFRPEAEVLVEHYGASEVFLLRVSRPGSSWYGDSRGYVALSDLGVRWKDLVNDGTLDDLADKLKDILP